MVARADSAHSPHNSGDTMSKDKKIAEVQQELKDKEHWGGDCRMLSSEQKKNVGLPDTAYLVVQTSPSQFYSKVVDAVVYDPVHWIYGRGNSIESATSDCLNNIKEYRAKKTPEVLTELTKGWEKRLEQYGHPFDSTKPPKSWKKKSTVIDVSKSTKAVAVEAKKPDEAKKNASMDDMLKDLGL